MSAWLVNRLLYGGIGLMPKNRWKIALDAGFLIIWRDQIFGFDVEFMILGRGGSGGLGAGLRGGPRGASRYGYYSRTVFTALFAKKAACRRRIRMGIVILRERGSRRHLP